MNAKEKFLNDIKNGMSIDEATRQCDAPRFACLIWARDAGLAVPSEARRIACRNQRIGMRGEDIFQELVPKAMNMNASVVKNSPAYDFYYRGLTIDVKTSTYHSNWHFAHLKPNCDFYCLIALNESSQAEHICLVPGFVFPEEGDKCLNVRRSTFDRRLGEFEVKPEELNSKLDLVVDGGSL